LIGRRVKSAEELEAELRARGYEPTDFHSGTGRAWRHIPTGRHIIVPDPLDGMYPDAIIRDIRDMAIDTRRIVDGIPSLRH
jgi:hypothetical protein